MKGRQSMPKKPHSQSTITPSDTYSIAVDAANSDLRVGGHVNFLVTGNQPPADPLSSGLSIELVATLPDGRLWLTAGLADRTFTLGGQTGSSGDGTPLGWFAGTPGHVVARLYVPAIANQTSLATCEFDVAG